MTSAATPKPSVANIIENCIGCKWTLHILGQIRAGVCRPGQLERSAEGLTAKVLSERLAKLMRFGILAKQAYPEVPPRVEYHLTPFGRRLLCILDQVEQLQRECEARGGVELPIAEPGAAADSGHSAGS